MIAKRTLNAELIGFKNRTEVAYSDLVNLPALGIRRGQTHRIHRFVELRASRQPGHCACALGYLRKGSVSRIYFTWNVRLSSSRLVSGSPKFLPFSRHRGVIYFSSQCKHEMTLMCLRIRRNKRECCYVHWPQMNAAVLYPKHLPNL